MTIQEMSRITGVSRDMIRYYEKIGLLKPSRTENGYRDFTVNDMNRIVLIKTYSNLGIPLKSLKQALTQNQMPQLGIWLQAHLQEIEQTRLLLEAESLMGKSILSFCQDMAQGKDYSIGSIPERYLYPQSEEEPASYYESFGRILSSHCAYHYYYRIIGGGDGKEKPVIEGGALIYPPVSVVAPEMIKRESHTAYKTTLLMDDDKYAGLEHLEPHLTRIRQMGYDIKWDILIYQINEYQKDNHWYYLLCVEIPLIEKKEMEF